MIAPKIAIIGTGITALSIGYHLPKVYPTAQITFFDKGQKVGGRVATRRSRQNQSVLFDHGAPYLTLDNIDTKYGFKQLLQQLDAIQPVQVKIQKRKDLKNIGKNQAKQKTVFIGKNGLDSIPEAIFNSLKNVKQSYFDHRVTEIVQTQEKKLSLKFEQSAKSPVKPTQNESFDQVFCCVPFPQAIALKQSLYTFNEVHKIKTQKQAYNANWIIMLTVQKGQLNPLNQSADLIDFSSSQQSPVISYAVRQNFKFPSLNNQDKQNWTVYFSDQWTKNNLNLTRDQVQEKFLNQIAPKYFNLKQELNPSFITFHRWLYSTPSVEQIIQPLVSQDKRLVFAGDWVKNRKNVGQCWDSGRQVIEKVFGLEEIQRNKSKL